jgi:hypothetical protein
LRCCWTHATAKEDQQNGTLIQTDLCAYKPAKAKAALPDRFRHGGFFFCGPAIRDVNSALEEHRISSPLT